MGLQKQQQARRAKGRAGGRMGNRARLTKEKAWRENNLQDDNQVARFFKSRDEQGCSCRSVDLRTREELRKM